jgi:hypothetical protein
MTSNASSVQEPAAAPPAAVLAEAARYALLRRLAPSMRHHLVVNLQPIGMIYEIMDRRLRAPQPDLAEVHQSVSKINGFARAALDSCLDVVSWLAPEEEKRIGVAEGVRECMSLLATSLTFRGYALRNEVAAMPGEVRRAAIRNVLTVAMIQATDETAAPADLVLSAERSASALELTLTLRPTDGENRFTGDELYRRLAWSDVEALAASERVAATRDGPQRVKLSIPWAT